MLFVLFLNVSVQTFCQKNRGQQNTLRNSEEFQSSLMKKSLGATDQAAPEQLTICNPLTYYLGNSHKSF